MTQRQDDGTQVDSRATYEAPRLVPLGALSELTLGPGGAEEDGLSGNLISEILP